MKYNRIILFFCIALPVSIIMRIFQLKYTIDTSTGFFLQEYKNIGWYLLFVILAFVIVTAILSFTSHRNPEKPPKPNYLMSISAVALAVTIGYELFTESFSKVVRIWQSSLLMITGFLAIIYLILFAIGSFVKFNVPQISAIAPAVYFILRIICTFTSISSLALITDNFILIASYCTTLLFMVSFAKVYNNIDSERNFRKLLASGLCSIVLCATLSIPNIIINVMLNNGYLHTSMATNISVLFTGLFTASFIFSHFSIKNCEE